MPYTEGKSDAYGRVRFTSRRKLLCHRSFDVNASPRRWHCRLIHSAGTAARQGNV